MLRAQNMPPKGIKLTNVFNNDKYNLEMELPNTSTNKGFVDFSTK